MKNLIKEALTETFDKLNSLSNEFKISTKSLDIMDVNPLDLVKFMKYNEVPDTAYFDGVPNGYDGYESFCLSWEIQVPKTSNEKQLFRVMTFKTLSNRLIYTIMIKNGYKRVGFNTALLKPFENTNLYNMFIHKEYDKLIAYYSLYYKKDLVD